MLEEITLSGIIAWLEQQPPDRMFYSGSPFSCLVNQYVADCWGIYRCLISTGLLITQTLTGEARVLNHSPAIQRLIIRFDQATPRMGQQATTSQALEIARSVLVEQERRDARPAPARKHTPICLADSLYTTVLLDLSVPLEMPHPVLAGK